MKIGDLITPQSLECRAACSDELAIFEEEWPNGATLTKNNIAKACLIGLNIAWFACAFLYGERGDTFDDKIETAFVAWCKAVRGSSWTTGPRPGALDKPWRAYQKAAAQALYETIKENPE